MPESPREERPPALPPWAREPLVQFAALAGIVFAVYAWRGDGRDTGPPPIVVDRALVDGLREARDEGDPVEAWIREEVLVREARALGLDRGDPFVRRRLAQKMELLIEASVDVPTPTDPEVEAALVSDPRYRTPATVTFEHRFFRSAREDALDAARRSLMARPDDPQGGDASLLGATIGPRSYASIESTFGAELAAALMDAEEGAWVGPLRSSHGAHLVRVLARTDEAVPATDALRARVRADLERERRASAVRQAIAARISEANVVREAQD